jgi:nicotinate dehydrogenase subunit B
MAISSSRRDFLAIGGGLLIGFSFADPDASPQLMAAPSAPNPSPARLDAWLRIGTDNHVRVFTGKVDIGMGVETALMQIVADELDIPVNSIEMVMGDTAATPDQGGVGGSTSISSGAKPLRNAAAAARMVLLQSASKLLGAPVAQLEVRNGVVHVKGSALRMSYGAVINGREFSEPLHVTGNGFSLNVQGAAKPKDHTAYNIVGKSVPRVDLPPKIFGRALYSTDIRLAGMLHGRVIRPAAAGSKLVSVDDSPAKAIAGYRQTVVKGNFVGVIAETEWAAMRAAGAVKVNWSASDAAFPDDLYQHMRSTPPKATRQFQNQGDVTTALAGGKRIEASYEWPFQAHATMGPGCAVADFREGGVTTVWTGAQKPHALQKGIAQILGVTDDRVRVVWVEAAGSYGRAGDEDVAADAVLLSEAVKKPVRVQWSRADMTAWGGKGPAAIVDFAAVLDHEGTIVGLEMTSRAFSGMEIIPQATTGGNMLAGQLIGMPNTTAGDEYVQWGGSTYPYTIPNLRCTGHVLPALYPEASPMRAMHLRDPNGPAGTFASESFIDELAAAAKVDPLAYRLRHTSDLRAKAVLNAAADRVKWDIRPSPKSPAAGGILTGRGIALSLRGGTYVATVAEVEVDRRSGAIRVKRLVCAHDCGLIVNPEALKGTIQANLIQSLGRTLKEEVTFDRTHVTSVDWATYPVVRWSDLPEVDVVLINHPEIEPSGAGEPSSRPTAAAIANAVFDATGVRIRRVPMTPVRVKLALA